MLDLSYNATERSRTGPSRLIDAFSLEVPPGRVAGFKPDSEKLQPGSFVFLPHLGGQESAQTGEACRRLVDQGYKPVPHVAARHLKSEQDYLSYLSAVSNNGADHLLVLAGDRDSEAGPYASALDLITSPVFRSFDFGNIMIGGYPEGHPRIGRQALDTAMERKLEALDSLNRKVAIVSQFSFDPGAYVTWVTNLRKAGFDHEVFLGVAGVTSFSTLIKYAVLCGIGPSLSILRKRGGAVLGMLGRYDPEDLIRAIAAGLQAHDLDRTNIHFFPFGGATKTLEWVKSVRWHEGQ